MISAVIAVLGTLAGSAITGALALQVARVTRRAAHRAAVAAAAADLYAALEAHRAAMWDAGIARLAGRPATGAHRDTRRALSAPYATLRVLAPAAGDAAAAAVRSVYALRDAATMAELDDRRRAALAAAEACLAAAAGEAAP